MFGRHYAGSAFLLAASLFGMTRAEAARYHYTIVSVALDPPGDTIPSGIDAAGNVVGNVSRYDQNTKTGVTYAFAYVNGKTKLATQVGGRFYSYPQGISSTGTTILYKYPVGHTHLTGLKWDVKTDRFSPLYAQGAPHLSQAMYINARGELAGSCNAGACLASGNTVTRMTQNAYDNTQPVFGLDDAGRSGGIYGIRTGSGVRSALFTFADGSENTFAIPGATSIRLYGGLSSNGALVGNYATESGVSSFVWRSGMLSSYSYPGASSTAASAINASGQMVGNSSAGPFLYQNGHYHLIALPDAPDATNVTPVYINDSGTIAGYFTPKNGDNAVTFVATCATGPGSCTP